VKLLASVSRSCWRHQLWDWWYSQQRVLPSWLARAFFNRSPVQRNRCCLPMVQTPMCIMSNIVLIGQVKMQTREEGNSDTTMINGCFGLRICPSNGAAYHLDGRWMQKWGGGGGRPLSQRFVVTIAKSLIVCSWMWHLIQPWIAQLLVVNSFVVGRVSTCLNLNFTLTLPSSWLHQKGYERWNQQCTGRSDSFTTRSK
jgi:hypothetical protein